MTTSNLRWIVALLVAAAVTLAGTATPTAATGAIDDANGTPGYCTDGKGVTVVVDFRGLGGDVIVRCAPGAEERTGLEALDDAGFEIEGTRGGGAGMTCRIEGRPAADENLTLDGKAGYRESCTEMPPPSAYWSYWRADNNGKWAYSPKGPKTSEATNGGFEGWSFALNAGPESDTTPRIEPARPTTDAASDAASDAPTSGTQDGVKWTGGEGSDEPVDSASEQNSSGSATPWAAAGVIGVLVVLIGVTTLRRRQARRGT